MAIFAKHIYILYKYNGNVCFLQRFSVWSSIFLSGNNIEIKKVRVQWCALFLCLQNLYSGGLKKKSHMRQDARRRSINRRGLHRNGFILCICTLTWLNRFAVLWLNYGNFVNVLHLARCLPTYPTFWRNICKSVLAKWEWSTGKVQVENKRI